MRAMRSRIRPHGGLLRVEIAGQEDTARSIAFVTDWRMPS